MFVCIQNPMAISTFIGLWLITNKLFSYYFNSWIYWKIFTFCSDNRYLSQIWKGFSTEGSYYVKWTCKMYLHKNAYLLEAFHIRQSRGRSRERRIFLMLFWFSVYCHLLMGNILLPPFNLLTQLMFIWIKNGCSKLFWFLKSRMFLSWL